MKVFQIFNICLIGMLICIEIDLHGQDLQGNPHKFKREKWNLNESCNPCHIYSAGPGQDKRFLFSYEYDSIVNDDSLYISGMSKLCITCHDGVVASFESGANLSTLLKLGMFVTHSHPVSVLYPVGKPGKTKFNNPNSTMSSLGGTIADDMLKNGRVECISCHDAHFLMNEIPCDSCPPNSTSYGKAGNYRSLLMTNERSTLCLICHKL